MPTEEIAHNSNANWFIHIDSDEIRCAPWKDVKLRDAIYYVDESGFNAIDHALLNFFPLDSPHSKQ